MQHLLNLFLCQSQATYARSFSLLPLQRHPGYTLKVAFCKLQHSYMVLATLVANQRRLKLGVGSCVASSFSDFRLLYPNLALCCCNSSWTVSFICFCSSISVFRLVSNRSHLLQVSLLVLPNDISNFVLNISWQNFPLLGILILICISPCTNHTLSLWWDPMKDIFSWDYLYDNNELTQLGSFECELAQTEHPLQGFCFWAHVYPFNLFVEIPHCIFDRVQKSLPLDIA